MKSKNYKSFQLKLLNGTFLHNGFELKCTSTNENKNTKKFELHYFVYYIVDYCFQKLIQFFIICFPLLYTELP